MFHGLYQTLNPKMGLYTKHYSIRKSRAPLRVPQKNTERLAAVRLKASERVFGSQIDAFYNEESFFYKERVSRVPPSVSQKNAERLTASRRREYFWVTSGGNCRTVGSTFIHT